MKSERFSSLALSLTLRGFVSFSKAAELAIHLLDTCLARLRAYACPSSISALMATRLLGLCLRPLPFCFSFRLNEPVAELQVSLSRVQRVLS